MANKLKVSDFKLGTNSLILFEQLVGGSLMTALGGEAQTFGATIEILACTYKDGSIESYSEFKEHPEFDDLVFRNEFLQEVFTKVTKDAENKRKKYQAPTKPKTKK